MNMNLKCESARTTIWPAAALLLALALASPNGATAAHRELPAGAFTVEQEIVLPGSPAEVYDAVTGDISGWWDHSFSQHPYRFYIEPRPGGGFWEIFDADGNGVRHAVVTAADRGKLLRFEGPLGLAGNALHMVTTYTLEPAGSDSTRLKLSIHAAGELQEGWPATVDAVWKHFLSERLLPYLEAGQHLRP
jgi:uncharacterized protein YndB with AHSA1/START domain